MLKPMLGVATAGVVMLLLWKLLAVILLPMLGVALVVVFTVLKVAFIIAGVCFAIWIFRRMSRSEASA